jgi:hypothetical protein
MAKPHHRRRGVVTASGVALVEITSTPPAAAAGPLDLRETHWPGETP